MPEYTISADKFKKFIQKILSGVLLFLDKTVCISYIFVFTI